MKGVDPKFRSLCSYLARMPSVTVLSVGDSEGIGWWAKLKIDIFHPLAWQVVQEFANVLNGLSLNERLPTVFKPVSPPPYLNGGPGDFLSWVIECNDAQFPPGTAMKWLEGRLPNPVDDTALWNVDG